MCISGHVLGMQEDVEKATRYIEASLRDPKKNFKHLRDHVVPMALYGQQTSQKTQAAVAKGVPEKRRVVFATNVAETSLTIDGVTVVVDAGFTKEALYDHQKRMKILQVELLLTSMHSSCRGQKVSSQAGGGSAAAAAAAAAAAVLSSVSTLHQQSGQIAFTDLEQMLHVMSIEGWQNSVLQWSCLEDLLEGITELTSCGLL